jgi:PAS domain S-box-containing protein
MHNQHTILIIDDSLESRKIYRQFLEENSQHRYKIIELESVTQALIYCQNMMPDLILINFILPDATGIDFLKQLKQQLGVVQVPVIILSALGDETIAVQAMKNGAQDYLVKGRLTCEALNRACNTVMERVGLMQQIEKQQEQQRLIGAIALRIRQFLKLEGVLNTAVKEICNFLKADRVLVYQFHPDMSGTVLAESVLPGWKSLRNYQVKDTYFCESGGKDYRQGYRFLVPNILEAFLSECHMHMLEEFQVQASMIVPIVSCSCSEQSENGTCHLASDNPLWGLLIVHQCSAPRQWQQSEVDLLDQLSVQLAIAIQQAELYQNLQTLNTKLETKLQTLKETEIALREKNALLQAIIQSAPVAVTMVNPNYDVMLWNPMAEKVFGYGVREVMNKPIHVLADEQQDEFQAFIQETLLDNPVNQVEICRKRKDGKFVDISLSTSLVQDTNGNIVGVMGIIEDISERKKAEAKMLQLQQRLEFLLSSSPGVIHTSKASGDYTTTFISDNVKELFGYEAWEYTTNKKFWIDRLHPDDKPQLIAELERIFAQEEIDLEYRFLDKAGRYRWVYDQAKLIRDEGGNPSEIIGYWLEISDRKQAELEVIHNRDLREAIFNESTDAIFLVDGDTNQTIDCNCCAVELFEASSKGELLGIEGETLQRFRFSQQEQREIDEALRLQSFWSGELEYITRKGNFFWGNLAFKQINIAGQEMSLIRVSDISDRKKSVEQIRRSLEEKETLLKEIHHRVKNNLQIISSLLRMQSRRPLDEATLILFQESQNRVQSMALIHEHLYQASDLSQIDFGQYIRSLTDNLFRCYGVSQRAIIPKIETNALKLSLDTAIPCGLIINELVSNSLKYAFVNRQEGEIKIILKQNSDNGFSLIVSDSGVGIAENFNWQNTNSLGLRIVHNLTRQIKGKISLERDASHHCGTTFYINFPKIQKI